MEIKGGKPNPGTPPDGRLANNQPYSTGNASSGEKQWVGNGNDQPKLKPNAKDPSGSTNSPTASGA